MPFDRDSQREQNKNFKVRRIRVYMKSDSPSRENLHTTHNEPVKEKDDSGDVKNEALNPHLENNQVQTGQLNQVLKQESNECKSPNKQFERNKRKREISDKIVMNSPFYEKRNKIMATFRKFSKILSKEEIDRYSSEIWRKTHIDNSQPNNFIIK